MVLIKIVVLGILLNVTGILAVYLANFKNAEITCTSTAGLHSALQIRKNTVRGNDGLSMDELQRAPENRTFTELLIAHK